jgi:hypothetical protein
MMENLVKYARYLREDVGAPSSILADILLGGSCPKPELWAEIMVPVLLRRVSLFRVLHQIDLDLAEQCRLSAVVLIVMGYFIILPITESHAAVSVTSQKNTASGSASVVVVNTDSKNRGEAPRQIKSTNCKEKSGRRSQAKS